MFKRNSLLKTAIYLFFPCCLSCTEISTHTIKEDKYKFSYHENNVVAVKASYTNGVRNGVTYNYYKTSELKSEVNYRNGKKEGTTINYYKNGNSKNEIMYVNNKREGVASYYFEDGTLFRKSHYKNDELHGVRETFYNGRCLSHIEYLQGFPQPGLLEFSLDGRRISTDYDVIHTYEDQRKNAFEVIIRIQFDQRNTEDRFFLKQIIARDSTILEPLYYDNGQAVIREYSEPESSFCKEYSIVAIHTTARNNPFVKNVDLLVELIK